MKRAVSTGLAFLFLVLAGDPGAVANPDIRKFESTKTVVTKHSVDLEKIFSGGPPKDSIPAIDNPIFASLEEAAYLADNELVTGVRPNGDTRAYATHILMWHSIVNDGVGNVLITITLCPLCNAAVVFDCRAETACSTSGRPVAET